MAKTGLVELCKLMEHAGRTVNRYAAAVQVGVALGVSLGTISNAEAAVILAFVGQLQAVIPLLKKLTGY